MERPACSPEPDSKTATLRTLVREIIRFLMDVALAGHSLGGALATLAAYDLATELGLPHVQCITFGAPRVGNSVFVSDYNRHVFNAWCAPAQHPCTIEVDALIDCTQEAQCDRISF